MKNNLEGSIKQEGNYKTGKGQKGMQMFDDIMKLSTTRSVRDADILKTTIEAAITVASVYFAETTDIAQLYALAGIFGYSTIQDIFGTVKSIKTYKNTLEEVTSHAWADKKELKRINGSYL